MPHGRRAADVGDELAPLVRALMSRLSVPGVSIGILAGGEEAAAGFGLAAAGSGPAVTPETLFQAGSIAKTVTATALVLLARQGALELDAPLARLLPDLSLPGEGSSARVTLRHLLTHSGGWEGDFFDDSGDGEGALAATVGKLGGLERRTPPGWAFSYNNAGFYIAGRVLEVLSGRPYEEAVDDLVLKPLGMAASRFMPVPAGVPVASGHIVVGGRPQPVRPWGLPRSLNPAAGLVTSAADLLRLARFHLRSLPEMRRPERSLGGVVGLAWMLERVGLTLLAGHVGATNGHRASLTLVPRHGFAVGVLTNADTGAELHRMVRRAALRAGPGLEIPDPVLVRLPERHLVPYAGSYSSALRRVTLEVDGDGLLMRLTPMLAMAPAEPPAPLPPPVRLGFTGADQVVALDPPFAGLRGEFLRENRRPAWFRWSGRLLRRDPEASLPGT